MEEVYILIEFVLLCLWCVYVLSFSKKMECNKYIRIASCSPDIYV
jgi:hypothetical protein